MGSISFSFQQADQSLNVPDSWQIAAPLVPKSCAPLADPDAALAKALEEPIGTGPLGQRELSGMKIVLAVDDVSRPTPLHLFFGRLLSYLEAYGARRENMLVLPALGVHRDMTQGEMEAKLGQDNLAGLGWENPDLQAARQSVDWGETSMGTPVKLYWRLQEADLVICVGAIEPHVLLGFGGGLKMICPGLAHADTIAVNHMQGVSHDSYNYVGSAQSPMRLDLEEAALKLGEKFFIVNALLNEKLEISGFVCGDPVRAHRHGVMHVKEYNSVRPKEKADLAIVISDPMNADLRQGMKCIANVEKAVKEGGVIAAFVEAKHGIGDVSIPPRSLPNRWLRRILRFIGPKRVLGFVDTVKKGAGTEERFLSHFSLQVLRKNHLLLHSPNLPPDVGKRMGLFLQYADPQEMLDAAAAHLPADAVVHLYPHGGVTYPSLP